MKKVPLIIGIVLLLGGVGGLVKGYFSYEHMNGLKQSVTANRAKLASAKTSRAYARSDEINMQKEITETNDLISGEKTVAFGSMGGGAAAFLLGVVLIIVARKRKNNG